MLILLMGANHSALRRDKTDQKKKKKKKKKEKEKEKKIFKKKNLKKSRVIDKEPTKPCER